MATPERMSLADIDERFGLGEHDQLGEDLSLPLDGLRLPRPGWLDPRSEASQHRYGALRRGEMVKDVPDRTIQHMRCLL